MGWLIGWTELSYRERSMPLAVAMRSAFVFACLLLCGEYGTVQDRGAETSAEPTGVSQTRGPVTALVLDSASVGRERGRQGF